MDSSNTDEPDVHPNDEDKSYYNKQIDGKLEPKHLDDISQEGWKLIAVAPVHKGGELHHYSYFFRRRRK